MRVLWVGVLLFLTTTWASATELTDKAIVSNDCTMTKTANINVNFNSVENDITQIESHFTEKKSQILALSRQADVEKLLLSSMSYSVSPQTGFQYSVSGSLSFSVVPADRATAFLSLLSKSGFNASLSMSCYPSAGSCDFRSLK